MSVKINDSRVPLNSFFPADIEKNFNLGIKKIKKTLISHEAKHPKVRKMVIISF